MNLLILLMMNGNLKSRGNYGYNNNNNFIISYNSAFKR